MVARLSSIRMSLVAVFASLLIGIGAANVFYYHNESQAALGLAQAQLESIATLKVEQIGNWRDERLNDVRTLQGNPMLEPMLPRWLQTKLTSDAQNKLVNWLDLIVSQGDYREAGLLDERGRPIAATVPILRIPPDTAALIDEVRATGKAEIGNLYGTRDVQATEVQAMDVVAPLQHDGKIQGFLLLRIAPERFLFPLLQKWPVQSASAETLLVEERDGLIVYLNELRHRKGTALSLSRATDDPTLPASYAARGENAFVDGADYRGIPVLGATRAVPGTHWGVVAKVDRSEITVPLNRRLALMLFSSMLLGLLAGGITYYLWQVQNQLVREQQERDAAAREEVERLTHRLMESQHIGSVGSWERDLVTNEIWWSEETYRIFNYTPAELPVPNFGSFLDRVHPEDRAGMELIIQSGVASGKPYTIDFRIVLPDGSVRILQNSGQLVRNAEGVPIRTAGTTQDITETRRHEFELRQRSEQMATIIENIPGGVSLMNGNLEFVAFNQRFGALLDFPEEMLKRIPIPLREMALFNARRGEYGPGDPEQQADTVVRLSAHPTSHVFERTRPNGTVLEVRGAPLSDGGFVTIYTDITARKKAEERLLLAEKVFDNSPEAIMITDSRNRIVSVNAAFEQITGFVAAEAVGQDPRILASGVHDRDFYRQMWETLQATGHWAGEIIDRRKAGDTYPKWMTINAVTDQVSNAVTHYVAIFNDITERKRAEERIRFLAHHDALTGLPNRFSLEARLEQSLIEARRRDWRVGVMFIDLDRFKMINDTLGHHIGDQLLIEVARRFGIAVRESDTVARLGGDEFVIVLPDLPHAGAAAHVAEKIVAALATPVVIDGNELHTSPSIGIGVYPDDGLDVDTVMKNADTAMYHAKALGRNNFQFFADEMNQATNERLSIENRLRRALDNHEFMLHYQPQFDADSMRLTGVEALLRWQPPDSSLVPPDRFIGIAEDNGLIIPIGNWVLREACRQMKDWQLAGLPALRVAVNLSARQLRNNDLAGTVAGILAETGLPPSSLELELTESAVMEKPEEAIKVLKALKAMGVSLAIDDFGTGYSSLAYLKLFPIDHLKIDRSFVRDIERDANDAAIAASTIALAHSLGLKVVAEGVETPAQLAMLRQHGCDELQGFLFSRPLPQDAIPAFTHEAHGETSRRLH